MLFLGGLVTGIVIGAWFIIMLGVWAGARQDRRHQLSDPHGSTSSDDPYLADQVRAVLHPREDISFNISQNHDRKG